MLNVVAPDPLFQDRTDAGRQLADRLQPYANRPEVLVLGLPRGGVPVATAEICDDLGLVVDEVVCVTRPATLNAIGCWYIDFAQTPDRTVCQLLQQSSSNQPGHPPRS